MAGCAWGWFIPSFAAVNVSTVRVALAQINPTVGDLAGNAKLIADAAREAHAGGAALMIAPELALSGYPPEDLLLRPAFMQGCAETLQALARELAPLAGLTVLRRPSRPDGCCPALRTRSLAEPACFNAASVLQDGRVQAIYAKRELPNYQVFDERRYFVSGRDAELGPVVFEAGGLRFGVLICEDAWFEEPSESAVRAGAQVLCVLNASPFHLDKSGEREARMAERAQEVGAAALVCPPGGRPGRGRVRRRVVRRRCQRARRRARALLRVRTGVGRHRAPRGGLGWHCHPTPEFEAQAWQALVTGVRDYLGKNGFPGAIIGLSGGIDSALVLAIAVDALGADRVRTVMMPSPYTADISWIDAREMAQRLGVRYDEIAIAPMFDAFRGALAEEFAACPRTPPKRTSRRASAARC